MFSVTSLKEISCHSETHPSCDLVEYFKINVVYLVLFNVGGHLIYTYVHKKTENNLCDQKRLSNAPMFSGNANRYVLAGEIQFVRCIIALCCGQ